jgi:putative sterol carrier protein
MADEQTPPGQQISPEMFRQMVEGRTDEELLAGIQGNEDALLDGIFDAMKEAFDPPRAAGQSAVVQYDLDTPRGLVSYQLQVDNGTCTVGRGTSGEPRATIAMNLPDFVRLMAGVLDAMTAWTSGKLKVSGDLMFTQTMGTWFKQPGS